MNSYRLAHPNAGILNTAPRLEDHESRVAGLENFVIHWTEPLNQFGAYRLTSDSRVTALETSRNDLNTFKINASRRLDHFDAFESNTTSSLGELRAFETDTKKRLDHFDTFETNANKRLENLDSFKTTASGRIGNLETWKKDEFEPWQKSTDAKISDLSDNKLNIKDYVHERKNITGRLDDFDTFKNSIKSAWHSHMPAIGARLDSLENKTKDLDEKYSGLNAKYSGLDSKLEKTDEDLKKVRSEMSQNHKKLAERIDEQGKDMKVGFETIGDEIKKLGKKAKDDNGKGGGKDDTSGSWLRGSGNNTINGGSGAGVNVELSNWGDISFIHAPNCGRVGNNTSTFCACMSGQAQAPTSLAPYGFLGSGYGRGDPFVSFPPRPSYRRRKSHGDLNEAASNYNVTPNVTFALSRQGGGGMFSKPKKEGFVINMGSGGGGGGSGRRRKYTSSDLALI